MKENNYTPLCAICGNMLIKISREEIYSCFVCNYKIVMYDKLCKYCSSNLFVHPYKDEENNYHYIIICSNLSCPGIELYKDKNGVTSIVYNGITVCLKNNCNKGLLISNYFHDFIKSSCRIFEVFKKLADFK